MNLFNRLPSGIRAIAALALMVTLGAFGTARADAVTDAAVDWIITEQVASPATAAGAYHWNPAVDAVFPNTQGATALGVLRAYERTGNPDALASAIANGDCQVAGDACITGFQYGDGDHRFATHDPLFLIELSRVSGDPQYATLVDTELWAKFDTASYGGSNNLDAAGFANAVLSGRTTQGLPEIVAFDLSKMAIAAHLANRPANAAAFMTVINQSLEAANGTEDTYDVVSLACAVWASSITGIDLDPAIGNWASADSTADLAALLITFQAPGGGFIEGSENAPATDVNASPQTTAFAMQALHAADPVLYASEVNNGFAFLTGIQQPNGHFGTTYVEGHGETMEAYADIVLAPPTDVYVDDDYVGDVFGDSESFTHPQVNGGTPITVVYGQDAFASIAAALDEVAVGGNVYVAEGIYVEGGAATQQNLVISRPVNLIGAQATVDARNRSDVGASIIQPGFPNATLSYASLGDQVVVQIASNEVTLDGFVLDGDNPALSSGVVMGTVDPDVDSGLYATGSNIEILNNVVRNLVYAGIYNYNYPPSVPAGAGNVIRNNWIHNIDAPSEWGIGIGLLYNFYADVDANLLENVRVGIQTNYNFKPTANPAVDAHIHDNEVHASATGIYHNYQDGLGGDIASPYTLDNNQIFAVNNPAQDGLWVGFTFQGLYESTAIIQNNHIDGTALAGSGRERAGYRINLITSDQASSTSVSGGTVSHVDYGVLATDGAFFEGALNDMNVDGIAFDDVSIAAFYVEDTAPAGSETIDNAPTITVGTGFTYNNVAHEAALAGPLATIQFAPGAPMFNTVLVRSANPGHRAGLPDSGGNVRSVNNAVINGGIGIAAISGVIDVEAGDFDQNVVVDKGVTLQGAFAGVPGHDVTRDGTGEAIISPATGRAVRIINTSNVVFDGFTIQDVNDTAISSGANYGGPSDTVAIINNRVLDVHSGSGLYTNGPVGTVANWTVANNLFRNIESSIGSGINLWKVNTGSITDNVVEDSAFGGIQINNATGVVIANNEISNTAHNGINVAAATDVEVYGNTIVDANTSGTPTEAGLTLYGNSSDVVMMCNSVSGGGSNGFSTSPGISASYSDIRVFDNALEVASDISHNLAAGLVIGSNWYGGDAATVTGANAGQVQVADPLAATPIGSAICQAPDPATANDAVALVVQGGSGQSTPVNTAFADPLSVRIEDALGGAVMGEAVSFAAPTSGASAVLGTPSGSTDFNGGFSTAASANGIAGSYDVTASSGALTPVDFALTNTAVGSVTWDALTFLYDGNTHAPTAHLTEEPSVSCVVTPATVGPDAGDYPVTATCDGVAYDATGEATATITPAPAEVVLTNLVQQFDGNPKPVTVTTTPAGVAVVVTYDGSSTAPSAVGGYAVVATVSDPNYSGSATGSLQIVEADAPDVAVSITDDRNYAQYGELLTYTITVNNVGNTDLSSVNVSAPLPADLENANPSWTCIPVGTATCTASGSGDLADTASIPAGGGVVYLYNAWVKDATGLDELIELTATVTAAGDVDSTNNSATDVTTVVLFRDGFELDGDGAEPAVWGGPQEQLDAVTASASQLLDLAGARASDGRVVRLAELRGAEGDKLTIEALLVGRQLLVRVVGFGDGARQLSGWTTVRAGVMQLGLGLAQGTEGQRWLLLVGALKDIEVPLADASQSLAVSSSQDG